MSDEPPPLPLICFALDREARPFLRRRLPGVRVVVTGVGRRAIRAALHSAERMSEIVVVGFAGALRPGIDEGEVVEVGEVIDESGQSWPCAGNGTARLLTSRRLIGDPDEKRRLGERFHADIVDMESAFAAGIAREVGVPFRCVRAVSDGVDRSLSPELVGLLSSGRVRPLRVAANVLRKPSLLPELIRLARSTSRAARNLAEHLVAHSFSGVPR